mmetsp:Transcript_12544/g.32157  ORF Transcript_12544/g.32157 Transcript_12544/m.32157 type:complete len:256 (+) Transcript_12544:408-1175(+)
MNVSQSPLPVSVYPPSPSTRLLPGLFGLLAAMLPACSVPLALLLTLRAIFLALGAFALALLARGGLSLAAARGAADAGGATTAQPRRRIRPLRRAGSPGHPVSLCPRRRGATRQVRASVLHARAHCPAAPCSLPSKEALELGCLLSFSYTSLFMHLFIRCLAASSVPISRAVTARHLAVIALPAVLPPCTPLFRDARPALSPLPRARVFQPLPHLRLVRSAVGEVHATEGVLQVALVGPRPLHRLAQERKYTVGC